MGVHKQDAFVFPTGFGGILIKSLQTYAGSFLNYGLLSVLTFLPFLILIEISRLDLMDMVEFFHGNFLDIIIFLSLPTLFMHGRVYPFATISLFMQRFFASAVIISFVQLGTLLFFILFFVQISVMLMLVGFIPYLFLLFAGFFLILENSEKLISVKTNLLNSLRIVRTQFFLVFTNYALISILVMLIPLFIFTLWYLGNHPDMTDLSNLNSRITENPEAEVVVLQDAFARIQSIIQEDRYVWVRMGIHVVLRPIKSLFLAFLFLSIIQRLSPDTVKGFLRFSDDDNQDPESKTIVSSEDENQHPGNRY